MSPNADLRVGSSPNTTTTTSARSTVDEEEPIEVRLLNNGS